MTVLLGCPAGDGPFLFESSVEVSTAFRLSEVFTTFRISGRITKERMIHEVFKKFEIDS